MYEAPRVPPLDLPSCCSRCHRRQERRRLGFDRVICFTPNDLVEPGAFEPDGVGSVADVSFSVFIRENVIRETGGTVGGVALLDSRMKSGSRVR